MKTLDAILAEERAAEEARYYKGYTVARLREVMDRVQNADGWKLPWAAAVPHQMVEAVLVAAEFFHADRAEVVGTRSGKVLMRGNGYQG
jgi:hypothetical protein